MKIFQNSFQIFPQKSSPKFFTSDRPENHTQDQGRQYDRHRECEMRSGSSALVPSSARDLSGVSHEPESLADRDTGRTCGRQYDRISAWDQL